MLDRFTEDMENGKKKKSRLGSSFILAAEKLLYRYGINIGPMPHSCSKLDVRAPVAYSAARHQVDTADGVSEASLPQLRPNLLFITPKNLS